MNIDDKLTKLEQSCEKLAKLDAESLNKKINDEIENQIETELNEYIKKQDISYSKQCEKLKKEYNKTIFDYGTDCKKNIKNVKEIINRELKEEVQRRLYAFTDTEEYKDYLLKSIDDGLKIVDNNEFSVIYVTKKDEQKFAEILSKYNLPIKTLDEDFIGGCKLKNENLGIIVDNTLKDNLQNIDLTF